MVGLEKSFKCKICGIKQTQEVSFTEVYNINNSGIDYIPFKCEKCGELHYVAGGGIVVDKIR